MPWPPQFFEHKEWFRSVLSVVCFTGIDIPVSQCYTLYIEVRYIEIRYIEIRYIAMQSEVISIDSHIRKVYVPMTETGFYILLCLREEAHGYSIVKKTEQLTQGEIKISPGTLYGSLSKMEKDGLIRYVREEEKRKIYRITELGTQVLELEMKRIERLYTNMKEVT